MRQQNVETSLGSIAVADAGQGDLALVFIHGNSGSSAIFGNQLESDLGKDYRLVAVDLPGHGQSGNAPVPEKTYSLPGYAAVVRQVAAQLDLERIVVVGQSLGGHVALEAAIGNPKILGLFLSGAFPTPGDPTRLSHGFTDNPGLAVGMKETLDNDDVVIFSQNHVDENFAACPPFVFDDIRRTDPLARRCFFESVFRKDYADAEAFVRTDPRPLALIYGAHDKLINTDHAASRGYRNLWRNAIQFVENAAHTPAWEAPAEFDALLRAFLSDLRA